MTFIELIRRWLVQLDHLAQRKHWPDSIWYDGDLQCRKCTKGGHRMRLVLVRPVGL